MGTPQAERQSPFLKGRCLRSRQRDSDRFSHIMFKIPISSIPATIPHPVGEHSGRVTRGMRFDVQVKRQLRLGSEVLCRTSAFGEGSLVLNQLHVIFAESLGLQLQLRRES